MESSTATVLAIGGTVAIGYGLWKLFEAAVSTSGGFSSSSVSSSSTNTYIDPDNISIPSVSKIGNWYIANPLDAGRVWYKDVEWTDGTRGKIWIRNENYQTDNFVAYKSEMDAINAEYVAKKYYKTRTIGKGVHNGKVTPEGIVN